MIKRLLFILPLFLSLKSYAAAGGASDEKLFILCLAGVILVMIALLNSPRLIRKFLTWLGKRRQLRIEKEKERTENNNYFLSVLTSRK